MKFITHILPSAAAGVLAITLSAMPLTLSAAEPQSTAIPGGRAVSQAVSLTATVEAIDSEKRVVSLKGPKGGVVDVEVPQGAANFDQIKVGDKVQVDYHESVALFLGKPGELPTTRATSDVYGVAKGDTPAAMKVASIDVSATIEAIDKAKREVTLKKPDGASKVVAVPESVKSFDSLKVGDTVHARFTAALAMAIKKQ
jgi:uncharacterized membrane protein (UPF0127 family)